MAGGAGSRRRDPRVLHGGNGGHRGRAEAAAARVPACSALVRAEAAGSRRLEAGPSASVPDAAAQKATALEVAHAATRVPDAAARKAAARDVAHAAARKATRNLGEGRQRNTADAVDGRMWAATCAAA